MVLYTYMPEKITLEAKKREITGKKVRKLCRAGILPGVLYGRGVETLPLEISQSEFLRVFQKAGENIVFELEIADFGKKDVRNVLIHDVSLNALSGRPFHVDFYQIRLDEVVRVAVPLVFVGESAAVENENGVFVKALQELEVEALPGDIPQEIEVDISSLATFEDAILVRDLRIAQNVKVLIEPETQIASVQPPRTDEELKALEQAPAAAAPEIVTEAEEKKKKEEAITAAEEPFEKTAKPTQ